MTTQVEQMAAQVSPGCTMVTEDNQVASRTLYPPADQAYETTIVATCRNTCAHSIVHELYFPSLAESTWIIDIENSKGMSSKGDGLVEV